MIASGTIHVTARSPQVGHGAHRHHQWIDRLGNVHPPRVQLGQLGRRSRRPAGVLHDDGKSVLLSILRVDSIER